VKNTCTENFKKGQRMETSKAQKQAILAFMEAVFLLDTKLMKSNLESVNKEKEGIVDEFKSKLIALVELEQATPSNDFEYRYITISAHLTQRIRDLCYVVDMFSTNTSEDQLIKLYPDLAKLC
jgi:hypothetical protein